MRSILARHPVCFILAVCSQVNLLYFFYEILYSDSITFSRFNNICKAKITSTSSSQTLNSIVKQNSSGSDNYLSTQHFKSWKNWSKNFIDTNSILLIETIGYNYYSFNDKVKFIFLPIQFLKLSLNSIFQCSTIHSGYFWILYYNKIYFICKLAKFLR